MNVFGRLAPLPAREHPELLADPVARALSVSAPSALVAAIDPAFADTEALCAKYGVPMEASANAVVVRGTRAGVERHAVCMTLAHRRVDVNGLVRRRLEARKASFAPMDYAVEVTGMEYGGITPVGLPDGWRIFIDERLLAQEVVVIGSGLRRSKLLVTGSALADLPGAEIVEGLGIPIA